MRKAEELCEKHGWFLCHQFENEANWKFHMETTGPEIIADFEAEGKTLTHWVTGYGTGGTFHGAGKKLKEKWPELKIVLAEPADAGLLVSGTAQERKDDGSPASSHPAFKPHPIQGWTPDFIPKVLDDALDSLRDVLLPIPAASAPHRHLQGPRRQGGPPHRHLGRRHHVGRARGRQDGAQGLGHPGDAARHGRALPLDAALRRDRR